MNLLTIQMVLAIGLILIGIVLMLWAYFNPKWQHADAYDSALPFAIGAICLTAGWVWGIAVEIIFLIRGA